MRRWKRFLYLLQRVRSSMVLRGWRGTLARAQQEFQFRPELDQELSLLTLDEAFSPFALPRVEVPRVSIIIPVYGQLPYTIACLRSLLHHMGHASFEVIVVDDCSPDESATTLAQVDGLRLVRNTCNLGFGASCNAGAAVAHGEFLMFLNNDTQVTHGWLDALLRCFIEHADCGIAGSRLVYPDGRLQEAGALVFDDASAWNIGRFEPRDAPAFRYRREVDYVSGASLMIRRDIFQRVGGFDARYAPAYYEDTDLAFAVRRLGLRVYYEPTSMIIHYEGITSGTDLGGGTKHHQSINRRKFAQKWIADLTSQPPANTRLERAVRWRARGHVLVVDATMPEPTRDSGSLRLCAILRLISAQGWSTTFAPDDGRASAAEIAELGALGVEVLCRPWASNLPRWLREHGGDLHAVVLCRRPVAAQYADLVRRHAPQARLLFDTVDLHFLREQRAAHVRGNMMMTRVALKSRRSELALIGQCDITLVVSPYEQKLLKQLAPHARVELLSNVQEIHACTKGHEGREDLVFIGGYGHPPNSDAIHWIATEILPRLRKAIPEIRLHVFGDLPEAARRELATPGLELHGRIADLRPWMDSCLVSLAPLRFGAGVKGKINMAMSYGLPVIATTVAIEGMQLQHDRNVLVADDAEAITAAVIRLQQDAALWERLSAAGRKNVREHFSPDAAAATLRRILD